ncbi:MAG: class I SAM-dependent RNA methyltransferase [Bacteroidales bacterium]|nr:class I SAM-dependent RNA methyltransferase [Bacteroidales bacterium]
MFGQKIKIIAKTLFGLENVLLKEVKDIGGKDAKILNRAVEFEGNLEILYKANLHLRTALSVIAPIHHFRAQNEKELYKQVYEFPWASWFNLHQTFSVHSVVHSNLFNHTKYVALKTKDAIADHFRSKYNERPNVDPNDADIRIVVHVNQDQFNISLDTSGKALFQRGYKTRMTIAPMNEVLAAGIILQSDWDCKQAFIDPMCGSGTLLIEAAMIASNFAPGLIRRRFTFQNLKNYNAPLWEALKEEAQAQINKEIPEIIGSDISEEAIEIAQENINNAGFSKSIKLYQTDISDFDNKFNEGILITNPPYDLRIKSENINLLYTKIGDAFKTNFQGFSCWMFSANLSALKNVGLKHTSRTKLYNGSLEGYLQKYEIYSGSKKAKHQS